jgi:transcription elongation GreA/GreB family factor
MAEIISFAEIQQARRRAQAPERPSLERAVQILRENLAAAAQMLADAAPAEQAELLARVEHLTALVRYGMRMLGTDRAPAEPVSLRR